MQTISFSACPLYANGVCGIPVTGNWWRCILTLSLTTLPYRYVLDSLECSRWKKRIQEQCARYYTAAKNLRKQRIRMQLLTAVVTLSSWAAPSTRLLTLNSSDPVIRSVEVLDKLNLIKTQCGMPQLYEVTRHANSDGTIGRCFIIIIIIRLFFCPLQNEGLSQRSPIYPILCKRIPF